MDFIRRQKDTEGQIHYDKYQFHALELVKYMVMIICVTAVFAYIFYKNPAAWILFMIPSPFYLKKIQSYLIKKRRQDLTIQFKEFCISMCAQLMAGYSIENAVSEVKKEMMNMYGNSYILTELCVIETKIKLNITIEQCFEDLGVRSDIEEIKLFAQIIKIAKRSGGDMIEIVRNAASSISQKIETEREVRVIINSKKYEQRIMDVMPLFIVLYVDFTSDMLEIMYKGLIGRIVMTICLIMYLAAFWIGEKLTDIEV